MQGVIYSVWDWRDGKYAYFVGPALSSRLEVPAGPQLVGDAPERLMSVVPSGSCYAGKGSQAIGTIARVR